MTITNAVSGAHTWMTTRPWRLWANQLLAVMRQELKQNFFSRRGIWVYLLAFAPAMVFAIDALRSPGCAECSLDDDTTMFAATFQLYYQRMGIFFGVLGIFAWLFRGQIVQRTLHYSFLAPLRREVLVVGKFLAGTLIATLIFGAGVFLSFSLVYGHFGGRGYDYVFHGPGLEQLAIYLGITALACIGYGAIFLCLTIIFKNPILPGICVLGWETFSGIFPAMMQRLSVSFYLKHLCPVSAPADGILPLLTVVTEPVAPWATVLGLLLLASTALAFACIRSRTLEISYSSEQ
jgi:ABC-type transport system involved in multi-copper enzyme maturation permease subunit